MEAWEDGHSGDTTSLGDEKRQELARHAAEGQRRPLGGGCGGVEGHEEGTAGGAGWGHMSHPCNHPGRRCHHTKHPHH